VKYEAPTLRRLTSHLELLEVFKAMINNSPHGAIIILSERTGGTTDVEYVSNLQREDQIKVLRGMLQRIEAARGAT
jgi:hypothetical protein